MNKVENYLILNDLLDHQSQCKNTHGTGFGHNFKIATDKVKIFFIDLFRSIAKAFSERSPMGKIYKFSINVLTGIGHAVGPFRGMGLLKVLEVVDTFNDFFDIVIDTDHLLNGRYRKVNEETKEIKINKCALVSACAFFVADVVGLVLWLNDLAVINLAKLSASIGTGFSKLATALGPGFARFTNAVVKACPFLMKIAAKVTLVNVLRGIVAGAFLGLAINECRKLVSAIREKNIQRVINRSLFLASYIAEIALKILALASCTCVPGLVVLGCLAAGFGLAAFVMKTFREYKMIRAEEEALEKAKEQEANPLMNINVEALLVA